MTHDVPQSTEVTVRDYIGILRRRKVTIVVTFLIVAVAAVLYLLVAPRVYESTSSLLVEGSTPNYARRGADAPFSDLYGLAPAHTAATAAQMLSSQEFITPLYRQVKLTPDDVGLKVQQAIGTDVVSIAADSTNPAYARKMAQAVPQAYVDFETAARQSEIDKTIDYARARLQTKSAELADAETALQRFQDHENVADLTKQRDARIALAFKQEADIRDLRIGLNATEASLQELTDIRRTSARGMDNSVVLTNPRIEEAKKNIADLEAERAKQLTYFKPDDAHIQEIDAQINSQKALLAKLPSTLTIAHIERNPLLLEADRKMADARTTIASKRAALSKAMAANAGLTAEIDRFNSLARQLADLQRTIDEDKSVVLMLTSNLEGLTLHKQAIHTAGITVGPVGPAKLVTPNVPVTVIVAVLLGLLLGLATALLRESLDTRLGTEEAHRVLGAPVLGYVPLVRTKGEWLYTPPYASYLLECYRVLRTNLLVAAKNKTGFSVLLSSTQSGEGKTVTAANVAIVMARSGKRVALVDADLHAPAIHEQFGLRAEDGLTDVLTGNLAFGDALKTTPIEGLRVLTTGSSYPNAGELLSSAAMLRLHEQLRESAEVVIFDGPPFLSGADSLLLASRVDGLVYIVQEGQVTSAALSYTADLLRHTGANVIGVVYNKVSGRDGISDRYTYRDRRYNDIPVEDAQRVEQETANWSTNSIVRQIVLAAAPGVSAAPDRASAAVAKNGRSDREKSREL